RAAGWTTEQEISIMPLTREQRARLATLARQLIHGLGAVEVAAGEALQHRAARGSGVDVLVAPVNPMVGPAHAANHVERIREQGVQDLVRLRQEPFVAHVLARDSSGQ